MPVKVFICTDHNVHYPVGGASVVIAENEEQAYLLLSEALIKDRLNGGGFTLQEISTSVPAAFILRDGEY